MPFRRKPLRDKLDSYANLLDVVPLTSLIIAILTVSLDMIAKSSQPAYAYDCMTNSRGDFVCIHSVYGVPHTSLKRVVASLNGGRPLSFTIDCANPDWDATSIYDKVCSLYR